MLLFKMLCCRRCIKVTVYCLLCCVTVLTYTCTVCLQNLEQYDLEIIMFCKKLCEYDYKVHTGTKDLNGNSLQDIGSVISLILYSA